MLPWLNTNDYTPLLLGLTLVGSVLWVLTYVEIIRNVHKNRYMEMPLIAVAGNFAWEGLFSWIFDHYINLGYILLWGYRAWFILDIYIVFLALSYGSKQFVEPILKRNFKPLFFGFLGVFTLLIWACVVTGLDNLPLGGNGAVRLGGISAYLLNLIISFGYIYTYLQNRQQGVFSPSTGWLKGLGTLCFSLFFYLKDPGNIFLNSMAVIVTLLDITYLILQYKLPQPVKKKQLLSRPLFSTNPIFEKIWASNPEHRKYFEILGIRFRSLTFQHWNSNDEGFLNTYEVLEGNIIRQISTGPNKGAQILRTTNTLRMILSEMELTHQEVFIISDARGTTGGDLESRKYTVELFNSPEMEKVQMHLVAGRMVRTAFQITIPISPEVMSKWRLFPDEEKAFFQVLSQLTESGEALGSDAVLDTITHAKLKERLNQLYNALASIADNKPHEIDIEEIPETDPFHDVFDALELINTDKNRYVGKLTLEAFQAQEIANANKQELLNLAEEKLYNDQLTKLPNRIRLTTNLEESSDKENIFLAVVQIRDYTKLMDFYGPTVAEQLLAHFTERFLVLAREENAPLYKLRLPEYAFHLPRLYNETEMAHFAEKIKTEAEKQVTYEGHHISCKIKIAFVQGLDQIFEKADETLKALDNKKWHGFKAEASQLGNEHQRNLKMAKEIVTALNEERVKTFFQPILNNQTHGFEKHEALVRLFTVDNKIISPGDFLPAARNANLYGALNREVITQVFKAMLKSTSEVSINISAEDIREVETFKLILEHMPKEIAHRVVFEILETEGMGNYEDVSHFIDLVKHKGCKIAIDDFGTGYSNFEHILRLSVDYIKIDGSLIKKIDTDTQSQILVSNIVDFSHKLGIKTIAEYVHNQLVFDKVKNLGVDYSQGFHLGAPNAQMKSGFYTA